MPGTAELRSPSLGSPQPAAHPSVRARFRFTDLRSAAVAAIVGAALLVTLLQYGSTFSRFERDANRDASLPRWQRELTAAYSIDISRDFLLAARRFVPEHATFAVVTGSNIEVSMPETLLGVNAYAQFYLFPRRRTQLSQARWLLCFGCRLRQVGVRTHVLWREESGIAIARIVR